MKLWVSDTSPLLFLAKLDRLDLLRQTGTEIAAPHAVFREIRQYADEASRKLEEARQSWLKAREVTETSLVKVLLADLDEGEAEVIALALELGADRVLLDDLDGRRLARRVGLTPVGTLGVLLAARQKGKIPSLRAEIEKLLESGFRAHEELVARVLRQAGEE
jgi:predicted nucleic acid-binding protein